MDSCFSEEFDRTDVEGVMSIEVENDLEFLLRTERIIDLEDARTVLEETEHT